MMTDTEITALAREYAEETHHGNTVAVDFAIETIRFMLRRYCLVEKDAVREALWRLTDKFLEDNDHKAFVQQAQPSNHSSPESQRRWRDEPAKYPIPRQAS